MFCKPSEQDFLLLWLLKAPSPLSCGVAFDRETARSAFAHRAEPTQVGDLGADVANEFWLDRGLMDWDSAMRNVSRRRKGRVVVVGEDV